MALTTEIKNRILREAEKLHVEAMADRFNQEANKNKNEQEKIEKMRNDVNTLVTENVPVSFEGDVMQKGTKVKKLNDYQRSYLVSKFLKGGDMYQDPNIQLRQTAEVYQEGTDVKGLPKDFNWKTDSFNFPWDNPDIDPNIHAQKAGEDRRFTWNEETGEWENDPEKWGQVIEEVPEEGKAPTATIASELYNVDPSDIDPETQQPYEGTINPLYGDEWRDGEWVDTDLTPESEGVSASKKHPLSPETQAEIDMWKENYKKWAKEDRDKGDIYWAEHREKALEEMENDPVAWLKERREYEEGQVAESTESVSAIKEAIKNNKEIEYYRSTKYDDDYNVIERGGYRTGIPNQEDLENTERMLAYDQRNFEEAEGFLAGVSPSELDESDPEFQKLSPKAQEIVRQKNIQGRKEDKRQVIREGMSDKEIRKAERKSKRKADNLLANMLQEKSGLTKRQAKKEAKRILKEYPGYSSIDAQDLADQLYNEIWKGADQEGAYFESEEAEHPVETTEPWETYKEQGGLMNFRQWLAADSPSKDVEAVTEEVVEEDVPVVEVVEDKDVDGDINPNDAKTIVDKKEQENKEELGVGDEEFTLGDKIGILGGGIGAGASLFTTIANRMGDKPSVVQMEDVSARAEKEMRKTIKALNASKAGTKASLMRTFAGNDANFRNAAQSWGQLRARKLANTAARAKAIRESNLGYDAAVAQQRGKIADTMFKGDVYEAQDRTRAAQENKADRDAF